MAELTGTRGLEGIGDEILRNLEPVTEAERWYLAYHLTDRDQGVYNALAQAAVGMHVSADRTATLHVYQDGSVIEWTAGDDDTYPDMAGVVDSCGDSVQAFHAAYPTVETE